MKFLNKILLLLLTTLLLTGCTDTQASTKNSNKTTIVYDLNTDTKTKYEYKTVSRVIDGDTFETEDGITVRMIGIDTPESVHPDKSKNTEYGKIASEYTTDMLTNRKVKLEYDEELNDKYGRALAYVYINDDMMNELLLEKGYAKTMTIKPNTKYADKFKEIENEAKKSETGFWKDYYKEDGEN